MNTITSNAEKKQDRPRRFRVPRPVVRFFGWWGSIFALLGPLSVCPFCGQPGCGVGTAAAGVFGVIVATLMTVPRWLLSLFRWCVCKEKETE